MEVVVLPEGQKVHDLPVRVQAVGQETAIVRSLEFLNEDRTRYTTFPVSFAGVGGDAL